MSEKSLKFYCAWFCPFAQRLWISLLQKGVEFEYIEQNPYNKTAEWLAISPTGAVPVLIHNGHTLYESAVCMEYVEDCFPDSGEHLLPTDPYEKAKARLLADHISKKIVPHFYTGLKKRTEQERAKENECILQGLVALMKNANQDGPFLMGKEFGFVDIMLAPFAYRLDTVSRHFCGFAVPGENESETKCTGENAEYFEKYLQWYAAVKGVEKFNETQQAADKLIDVYRMYAEDAAK